MDGARILEPILRLRDRTGNKVKFVFSGIHNAAAAAEAEGSGSCLLRMGEPLCVGPLSVGAAKRLIRTPLAYLGFEIQEPQTDLILALSGCCPGLIQAFCRNLVLAVSRDFHLCFGMGGGTAPFRIGEKQMLTVFRTKDMRRELTAWRMSGLKTDRRYEVVSALLAHMTCEDQEMKCCRLHGYSARALADYNLREFRIPLLTALGESGMEVLLNEMSQMGILRYSSGTRCYRFRRQEYLGFVGTSEQILDFLLNESEEEEMAV